MVVRTGSGVMHQIEQRIRHAAADARADQQQAAPGFRHLVQRRGEEVISPAGNRATGVGVAVGEFGRGAKPDRAIQPRSVRRCQSQRLRLGRCNPVRAAHWARCRQRRQHARVGGIGRSRGLQRGNQCRVADTHDIRLAFAKRATFQRTAVDLIIADVEIDGDGGRNLAFQELRRRNHVADETGRGRTDAGIPNQVDDEARAGGGDDGGGGERHRSCSQCLTSRHFLRWPDWRLCRDRRSPRFAPARHFPVEEAWRGVGRSNPLGRRVGSIPVECRHQRGPCQTGSNRQGRANYQPGETNFCSMYSCSSPVTPLPDEGPWVRAG